MKYFLRYLKPHVLTMCFGFFIKFSGTIMDLLIPYILSYIIDEVTPKNDIGLVVRWGLLMILCAALVLLAKCLGQPDRFRRFPGRESMRCATTSFTGSPIYPAPRWISLRFRL